MKKKTFTIFGHTGFIGSHLKKRLQYHKLILPKRGEIILNKNLGNIIYCVGSDLWKKNPYDSFHANLGYVPEILKNNKFSSFNFLSSIKVYDNVYSAKESSTLKVNPNDPNAYFKIKKICAESILFSQTKKFKVIRLGNIYGNNFNAPLALSTFIRDAIKLKKINLTVNENSLKDYLSIEDAINLILLIINKGKKNIYNVASGKRVSFNKITSEIKKITNCKVLKSNKKVKINEPKIDIKRIKNEFKFKQSSNLLNDLKNLILEFKKKNNINE